MPSYDGSSGHSVYSQQLSDSNTSDESLFLTSLVPLRICSEENRTIAFWQNPKPSSVSSLRPLRFEIVKESKEVISAEVSRVRDEIGKLERTEIVVRNKSFYFEYETILSMMLKIVVLRTEEERRNRVESFTGRNLLVVPAGDHYF